MSADAPRPAAPTLPAGAEAALAAINPGNYDLNYNPETDQRCVLEDAFSEGVAAAGQALAPLLAEVRRLTIEERLSDCECPDCDNRGRILALLDGAAPQADGGVP